MSEETIKELFGRNLNYFLNLNSKTQKDLVSYMGVASSTVSDWVSGKKMPRMDKIQSMCNWLGIEKSDLLEDRQEKQEQHYYLNEETREIAQEIFENRDMKILFDVARNTKPETLKTYAEFLRNLQKEEHND